MTNYGESSVVDPKRAVIRGKDPRNCDCEEPGNFAVAQAAACGPVSLFRNDYLNRKINPTLTWP